MTTSPDLGLPFIAQQQSQPEVTHNQAIAMLSALMKGVLSIGDTSPPGSPTDGDTYVLGSSPTGDWAGQSNKIAIYLTNAWVFVPGYDDDGASIAIGTRHYGLRVWVQDVGQAYVWNGTSWQVDTGISFTAADIAIDPPPTAYATDVQSALDELFGAIEGILAAGPFVGEAPADGTAYSRKDQAWVAIDATDVAYSSEYGADVAAALDIVFAVLSGLVAGGGGSGASTAEDVSVAAIGDLYGANVQEALEEIAGRIAGLEAGGGGGGLADAPSDTTFYGRRDAAWGNPVAADIFYAFDYGATVEAALDYLIAGGGGGSGSSATTANEVSIDPLPDGGYGANVQEALEEFDGRLISLENNSGWELIDSYDFSTTAIANWDVLIPSYYNDILIQGDDLTAASSEQRRAVLSTDGGSSFYETSGNYGAFNSTGFNSAVSAAIVTYSSGTGSRYLMGIVKNIQSNSKKHIYNPTADGTNDRRIFTADTLPINAIRMKNDGGSNITGGIGYVYGRR